MEQHPILGRTLEGAGRIYTRTIVLWAVGIDIDTDELWKHVDVKTEQRSGGLSQNVLIANVHRSLANQGPDVNISHTTTLHQPLPKRRKTERHTNNTSSQQPVVRMLSTSTHRRGDLLKRMRNNPFRSVLSMDVEFNGCMPNLKISNRNTIQATETDPIHFFLVVFHELCSSKGCQDMQTMSDILGFLVNTYRNRGFNDIHPRCPAIDGCPGFVGDIVLANVHFKLGWRVDRTKLRDVLNTQSTQFIASYEPFIRDVSVSIKHYDSNPLPNSGAVYPRWSCKLNGWSAVAYHDVMRLVPHAAIKQRPHCHTFRVFATGSVVQVGRWPWSMQTVYHHFFTYMMALHDQIVDSESANQPTLFDLWPTKEENLDVKHEDP
jgi:hypothetical protein